MTKKYYYYLCPLQKENNRICQMRWRLRNVEKCKVYRKSNEYRKYNRDYMRNYYRYKKVKIYVKSLKKKCFIELLKLNNNQPKDKKCRIMNYKERERIDRIKIVKNKITLDFT